MATLGQERSKRHSAGYGEDRSDLYGSYDSYGSYGYSSGGGGGGYGGCGCCHQKQDSLLLPLILAGIAAAAGYLFGRNNNNNGRNFGPQPTITARSAQVILDGKWSGGMEVWQQDYSYHNHFFLLFLIYLLISIKVLFSRKSYYFLRNWRVCTENGGEG